jgi:hypothetical protein
MRRTIAVLALSAAFLGTSAEGCDKTKDEAYNDGTLKRTKMVTMHVGSGSHGFKVHWQVRGGNFREGSLTSADGEWLKTLEFVQGVDEKIIVDATSPPTILSCNIRVRDKVITAEKTGRTGVSCTASSQDIFK